MAYKVEIVDGNKLAIVIDISPKALSEATKSKSAIAKLVKGGMSLVDATNATEASLVATSGGFIAQGPVKLSFNVTKA